MYFDDNGRYGREHYEAMIEAGKRERFAALVERHQRQVNKQQSRKTRQPRWLALLSSLTH